ncbi:MAG: hypothetical protein HY362_03505 [Candidatus Aenigmarchaeota archaeon]|nr:hypothetical protein [Candidatus Aenigmarchaeota archaeon]
MGEEVVLAGVVGVSLGCAGAALYANYRRSLKFASGIMDNLEREYKSIIGDPAYRGFDRFPSREWARGSLQRMRGVTAIKLSEVKEAWLINWTVRYRLEEDFGIMGRALDRMYDQAGSNAGLEPVWTYLKNLNETGEVAGVLIRKGRL